MGQSESIGPTLVKQYRQRGENVILFYECQFLALPASEVLEQTEEGLLVNEADLTAAYDLTPDLPCRVLHGAWKRGLVFYTEVANDVGWCAGVAHGVKGLSAHDIIKAFIGV